MAAASPDVILLHPAEFRQFRNQHGRRNRANPGDGPQEPGLCSRGFLLRDDVLDPSLEIADLRVQQGPEVRIHALDVGGDVLLPARRDLGQKPLTHVHDVGRRNWQTRREVEIALFEYINGFYKSRRKHSALGWKSPVAFEQGAP